MGMSSTMKSLVVLLKEERWSTVLSRLLTKFGRWESRKVAKFGRLPLHVACQIPHIPIDVINYLLDANPAAAKRRDDFGDLPLHWACERGVNVKVVRALIAAYPQGVRTPTYNRVLPIHFALHSSSDVVRLLLKEFPDGARAKNELGQLPLLHACQMGIKTVDRGIISSFIDAYPEAATVTDSKGFLPLHWCCVSGVHPEEVRKVLDVYPRAASFRAMKAEGLLPLHVAGDCGCEDEVLQMIFEANPDAVITPDKRGRYPIYWTDRSSGQSVPLQSILSRRSLSIDKLDMASEKKEEEASPPVVVRQGSGTLKTLVADKTSLGRNISVESAPPTKDGNKNGTTTTTLLENSPTSTTPAVGGGGNWSLKSMVRQLSEESLHASEKRQLPSTPSSSHDADDAPHQGGSPSMTTNCQPKEIEGDAVSLLLDDLQMVGTTV